MVNKFSKYVYKEKIQLERHKRNIKLREMADRMGYNSLVSYKNIEDGVVEPKISTMIEVSRILGKPITYFFNLTVQEN